MLKRQTIPEGVRVLPDGSWRVGDQPIAHARRLRYLKQRLVFEDGGAFLVDGLQRFPLALDGPPFQVDAITFDAERGAVRVGLDDASEEVLTEAVIRINAETGRFECSVKGGRTRAILSNVAHQRLLDHLEHDGGQFYVPLGERRCRVLP